MLRPHTRSIARASLLGGDSRFQRGHPLPQRRIAGKSVGDDIGCAVLIAGFEKADLVLGRQRGDLREQRLIRRVMAAGE